MIKIGKRLEDSIRTFSAQEYPKEACGIITKVGKKLVVIKCTNVSTQPETTFVIDRNEYRHHLDEGGVFAIWHSHVNEPSNPSPTDIAACDASGVDWLIIDVWGNDESELLRFGPVTHLAPRDVDDSYLERLYVYGIRDCFSLAHDYYLKEFGIDIDFRAPGYPENFDWVKTDPGMLVNSYEKAGFAQLHGLEPEVGDIFLIQTSSATDHIAIYVGNDQILHHNIGRLSTIHVYGGGYWQKHTTHHLRHLSRMGNNA